MHRIDVDDVYHGRILLVATDAAYTLMSLQSMNLERHLALYLLSGFGETW